MAPVSEEQFAGTPRPSAAAPLRCEIRAWGQLDGGWSAWFGGLAVVDGADGEAVLAGKLADQATLKGVLTKARDLGLPLFAVTCTARNEEA